MSQLTQHKCPICLKSTKKSGGIQCSNQCERWFHVTCAGISEELFEDIFKKVKKNIFVCDDCLTDIKDLTNKNVKEPEKHTNNSTDQDIFIDRTTNDSPVNQRIDKIEDIFQNKNPTLRDVLQILKEILHSQEFISIKYEETILKNQELQESCNSLTKENAVLKKELKKIQEDVVNLERNFTEKKLEIHGVPKLENENINDIVIKIANHLGCNITESDIDMAYRIKAKFTNSKKEEPIIVTFCKKGTKEDIIRKRKKKKYFFLRN